MGFLLKWSHIYQWKWAVMRRNNSCDVFRCAVFTTSCISRGRKDGEVIWLRQTLNKEASKPPCLSFYHSIFHYHCWSTTRRSSHILSFCPQTDWHVPNDQITFSLFFLLFDFSSSLLRLYLSLRFFHHIISKFIKTWSCYIQTHRCLSSAFSRVWSSLTSIQTDALLTPLLFSNRPSD